VKTIEEYADEVMTAIDDCIAEGRIPADVATYSDLHSYVDANDFLLDAGVPWGTDIPEGQDPNGVWVDVENEVQRRLRVRTWAAIHARWSGLEQCHPDAHDRSVPTGPGAEHTADDEGLLTCNACGAAMYYCHNTGWYHHVDPGTACPQWRA